MNKGGVAQFAERWVHPEVDGESPPPATTGCHGIPSRINPSRPHIQCVGNSTGLLARCTHYVPLADESLARVDGKGTCLSRLVADVAVGG